MENKLEEQQREVSFDVSYSAQNITSVGEFGLLISDLWRMEGFENR